jgi:5-methylcytosine-specific restriction endonuclease McrA
MEPDLDPHSGGMRDRGVRHHRLVRDRISGTYLIMPARALRPCAKCGALTNSRFCAVHVGEPRRMAQVYDSVRANDPIRRLYGTRRWRYTSKQIIVRDPVCRGCGREPSTLADHVKPAEQYVAQHGGDLESFFDPENLQGLGVDCHAKKTARDRQMGGRGGRSSETPRPATGVQPFARVSRSEKMASFCHASA